MSSRGPLDGVSVLDMSALGPGPFCGMYLAGHGADVIEIRRPGPVDSVADPSVVFSRGKRSIVVDIRVPEGAEVVARLSEHADVLLESNRPGVLERRGLGPERLLTRNPRLVYARLTGWGQHGPRAEDAGHDINYIAGAGMLGAIAGPDDDRPIPPMNIVGDFASGSLMAALGIVMALYERQWTGRGQVVDAAMVDGAALLLAAQIEEFNGGVWAGRGRTMLSGRAPFYSTYRCSDGHWFAVGAIEPHFYENLLKVLGIDDVDVGAQFDPDGWDALRARFAERFAQYPSDHWAERVDGVDACANPVLELDQLVDDPHLVARGTIGVDDAGMTVRPAPRLGEHVAAVHGRRPVPGGDTRAVLVERGFTDVEVDQLIELAAVR